MRRWQPIVVVCFIIGLAIGLIAPTADAQRFPPIGLGGGAPTGAAGGDLGGTYPNPSVDLNTGRAGGQTIIGGTAAGEDITFQTTSNATKGQGFFGTDSFWDQGAGKWGFGTQTVATSATWQFNRSVNGTAFAFASNDSAGANAQTGFRMGNDATNTDVDYFSFGKFGTGFTTVGPLIARGGLLELNPDSGTTAPLVISNLGAAVGNTILLTTGASRTTRVEITSTAIAAGNDVMFRRDVNAGITASTTQTQGNGALTAEISEVSTVANALDTVTYPAAVAGLCVMVINNGANQLQVFPASGDRFPEVAADASITLAPGSTLERCAFNGTLWEATSKAFRKAAATTVVASEDETWLTLAANSSDITGTGLTTVMTVTNVGVGRWTFDCQLIYQTTAGTTGIDTAVNHTGTTTQFIAEHRKSTTGAAASTADATETAAGGTGNIYESQGTRTKDAIIGSGTVGVDTINADMMSTLIGFFVVSVSGSFEVKLAAESAGLVTRAMQGSNCVLRKG